MNMMDVVKPWESVNAALGLSGAIRDEVHYKALLDFVENCFNRFGTDEHHPIFALVDVVSDIVSGKRSLNLRQVKALAQRFHVPMEVFTG